MRNNETEHRQEPRLRSSSVGGPIPESASIPRVRPALPEIVSALPSEPEPDGHYRFSVNRSEVVANNHDLHKFPAKFIPQIPQWGIAFRRTDDEVVVDPFCGSGTTVLEAALRGDHAMGFDISPLAVLISRAKIARLDDSHRPEVVAERIVREAKKRRRRAERTVSAALGDSTWTYWFRPREMAALIAMGESIAEICNTNADLRNFLLTCVSAIAKSASYLSEDQIKVRYDHGKDLKDPFEAFVTAVQRTMPIQQELTKRLAERGATASVGQASADRLPLEDSSATRIVTSPPYINAVDYTMTQRYNLFILGLVHPDRFKAHCREYIGMTERAVRAGDLRGIPNAANASVQTLIERLWVQDTPTARNRAFVVGQFFRGMFGALREMHRVLVPGGRAILVVGSENRICGEVVPTGELLEHVAGEAGFKLELRFFHHLANRSSMRLTRGATGGKLKTETVLVFKST